MDAFFKLSSNGVRLPISLIVFLLIAGNVLVADAQSVDEPFSLVILSDTQVFRAHNPLGLLGEPRCNDPANEGDDTCDRLDADCLSVVGGDLANRFFSLIRLVSPCNPVIAADAVVDAINQMGSEFSSKSWPADMRCTAESSDSCISQAEDALMPPLGVVINGDLTEAGSLGFQAEINAYERLFEDRLPTIWPGLGNHDYSNGLDKDPPAPPRYSDVRDAIQWMADKIAKFNSSSTPLTNHDLNGAVVVKNHDRLARKGFRVLVDGKPKTNIVVLDAIGAGREKVVELGDSFRQPWRKVSVRFYDWVCTERALLLCVKRGWSQIESRTIADAEVSEVTCFDILLSSVIRPNCGSSIDSVNRKGSLSYSFEHGNYRFIQLHNYLGYERDVTGNASDDISEGGGFKIVSANDTGWLTSELTQATADGKAIVINVHDADKPLFDLIRANSFNVVAVFGGHLHEKIGRSMVRFEGGLAELTDKSGRVVPVIWSGAALAGTMLYVEFYDDYINWAAMRAWGDIEDDLARQATAANPPDHYYDRPPEERSFGLWYGLGDPVFMKSTNWRHFHDIGGKLPKQGTIEFDLVKDGYPPTASCTNVAAFADSACTADASINNGSNDPDGGDVTLSQTPSGPYGPGTQPVTLTVLDNSGSAASCEATVTVLDVDKPQLICGGPAEISLADLPVSFVAEASDNCGVSAVYIDSFQCLRDDGAGPFCQAQVEGDTITVSALVTGGSRITWTAISEDESGNATDMSCAVNVVAVASVPRAAGGAFGVIELLLGFLLLISVRYRRFMDAMRTQTSLICPDVAA